jgi:ATP-dependent RNA helicase DeaD
MTSPAEPAITFADLQIHPAVLQAVVDVGYETPSAIQAATIPALMAGSDVVGLAQTGTGKTAAFAIPILSRIDTTSNKTQALVLAPGWLAWARWRAARIALASALPVGSR